MPAILLIDDDTEVLMINKKYLTGEGYTIYTTSDASKGIAFLRKSAIDCIVLDIMMPGLNGFDVCERIRSFSSVPVIFLTGKDAEDDRIHGLEIGADDYVVKPYSLRELKTRIDVILRRANKLLPTANQHQMTFGNLIIDKLAHKATYKGHDLGLTNREYDLLIYLATHPNQELTFKEIGISLFGSYMETDRRIVMVNMSRLRKKMNDSYELENMIETVWSKGYRFISK